MEICKMTTITNVYTEEPMLQGEEVTLNGETFLVEAIAANLGAEVEMMLNEGLKNSTFSVKLHIDDVKRDLELGYFAELMLNTHHLIIPKELLTSGLAKKVQQVFTVEEIVELNNECVFKVYLGEGPWAITVESTLLEINENLGIIVEKLVKEAGLENYKVIFNITAVAC